MRQVLTGEENELVSTFKKDGVFQRFTVEELRSVTKNGGVAIICSDGDIDAYFYHTKISQRPHAIKVFGGPLILSPDFAGYNKIFTQGLIENLKWGMEAKQTETIFLYSHYPCGVAIKFRHYFEVTVALTARLKEIFLADSFFKPDKIYSLFHVKRMNKSGQIEQNTYRFTEFY